MSSIARRSVHSVARLCQSVKEAVEYAAPASMVDGTAKTCPNEVDTPMVRRGLDACVAREAPKRQAPGMAMQSAVRVDLYLLLERGEKGWMRERF